MATCLGVIPCVSNGQGHSYGLVGFDPSGDQWSLTLHYTHETRDERRDETREPRQKLNKLLILWVRIKETRRPGRIGS